MTSVSETVAANLQRIRAARGMTVAELARAADTAKATLTQLERGNGNPTLATLYALADALGTPLGELIAEHRPPSRLVRASEGQWLRRGPVDSRYVSRIEAGRDVIEIYELRVSPGNDQDSQPHRPGVLEYLYVTQGPLAAGPTNDMIELEAGDYIAFRGDTPHRYVATRSEARALCAVHYRDMTQRSVRGQP
jgi:transcriptional regulator with XRE-family HTH domain